MISAHQYEIQSVLHAGEQFEISLAYDEYGQQVAEKQLVDPSDECATARLQLQSDFLKQSSHPGIVNFRDADASTLYMDGMAGDVESRSGELNKLFSTGDTVSFLRQMLTLLSHLQSRELTAGQLSPRTILCNEDLTVFKIAKAYQTDEPIPADINEKIFPPEVNSAAAYDVHASDIYCLGMTCVELVLGSAAFVRLFNGMYDDSSDLWIRWHENQHETLPPLAEVLEGFPVGLTDIIEKMIQKPLELRYASADQALKDLNRLGIVDDAVTVEAKSGWHPMAKIISCAAVGLLAVGMWSVMPAKKEPAPPKAVVEVAPVFHDVKVTSNRAFQYKIVGDDEEDKIHEWTKGQSIPLQEGEQLIIVQPNKPIEGWSVLVNDELHLFGSEKVKLPYAVWNENGELTLEFRRELEIVSNYKRFEWKLKNSPNLEHLSSAPFGEGASFLIHGGDDVGTEYLFVRPKEANVKLADATPDADGWSKKQLASENQIKLKFVLPVEVELVDLHESLKMGKLNVSVNGEPLQLNQNKFCGDIPYRKSESESKWKLVVEKDGWKSSLERNWGKLPGYSATHKTVELTSNVTFELPEGYKLQKANGKTDFYPQSRSEDMPYSVDVPYGAELDYTVTDRKGVIQISKNMGWERSIITVDSMSFLKAKRLRNYGNQTSFELARVDNPDIKKSLGRTGEMAWLPMENKGDYMVIVASGTSLERKISLADFVRSRKPVELWQAGAPNQRFQVKGEAVHNEQAATGEFTKNARVLVTASH